MSALSIEVPFPVFQDRDGQPLENGYVWLGVANLNPQTNPVIAYFDKALTIPAAQPLRTINGYISNAGTPAQVFVDGMSFSILVQDSKGSMVYNFPDGTGISPDACGVSYDPPFAGAVAYPVCEKLDQTLSVKDFGAVGDGVADDTVAIQAAVNAANGKILDFINGVYLITTPISSSYSEPTQFINGNIVFSNVTQQEYIFRVRTTSEFYLDTFNIDGQAEASKLMLIHPNNTSSAVYVNNYTGKNGLQTNVATSFAAGIQISPEIGTGTTFASCFVSNSTFSDITSTKTDTGILTTVGRGVWISDCENAFVSDCLFERIGPYQDGDGLALAITTSADPSALSANVTNCYFVDCEKRSIKSQINKTMITDVQCARTQPFTDNSSGQCEISLQAGGVVDGAFFDYANNSAPRFIVEIAVFGASVYNSLPGSVRNLTIRCKDETDVITALLSVILNNASSNVSFPLFENVACNAKVRNILNLRNRETSLAARTLSNCVVRNVKVKEFSTDAEAAYVFMTRGSASFFTAETYLYNISSDNEAPFVYRDPAPGSTTFLIPVLVEAQNLKLTEPNALTFLSPIKTLRNVVNESAVFSETFTLNQTNSAVLITVTFTSVRDTFGSKLVTQGIIQSSSARTYYRELIAGNKSASETGAISIDEDLSGNTFTVSKTAGTTSATGILLITLQDIGYVQ